MPSVKCVRVDDERSAGALMADGWRFVQTLVTYSIPSRNRPERHKPPCDIVPWTEQHFVRVVGLLGHAKGRLHLDPEISEEEEAREKAKWLSPGDDVIVAVDDGVIGFCKTVVEGENLRIDLIVVDPVHQMKGVGRALVAAVRRWAYQQDYRNVVAGTSLENHAGCCLYEGQGFTEIKRQKTFHK